MRCIQAVHIRTTDLEYFQKCYFYGRGPLSKNQTMKIKWPWHTLCDYLKRFEHFMLLSFNSYTLQKWHAKISFNNMAMKKAVVLPWVFGTCLKNYKNEISLYNCLNDTKNNHVKYSTVFNKIFEIIFDDCQRDGNGIMQKYWTVFLL